MIIKMDQKYEPILPLSCNDLIRIGRKSDGGYVLPKSILDKIDGLLSLGIGDDWSFEKDILSYNSKIQVIGSDFTITKKINNNLLYKKILKLLCGNSSISEVKKQYKFGVDYDDFYGVYATNLGYKVSNKNEGIERRFIKILNEFKSSNIYVKMDIEGAEYLVLDEILSLSEKIIGMSIEFHNCGSLEDSFLKYINIIKNKYILVHNHINNEGGVSFLGLPEVYEMCFIRKDMINSVDINTKIVKLPYSPLDVISNPLKDDISITLA